MYEFKNKELEEMAFTHSSKSAKNYERLEFLGDSILDFLVAEYLFQHSEGQEGSLTKLRAHYVSEKNLCKIADEINLTDKIKMGKSYKGEVSKSIKADVYEAVLGAIYLDSGLGSARKFVLKTLKLSGFKTVKNTDFKSELQEYVQAEFKSKIKYKSVAAKDGFKSDLYLDDDKIASGAGSTKIEAEQKAAEFAMKKLFD